MRVRMCCTCKHPYKYVPPCFSWPKIVSSVNVETQEEKGADDDDEEAEEEEEESDVMVVVLECHVKFN